MKKILKILNHNSFTIVAVINIVCILFWAYGCQSKVISLNGGTLKVSRPELQNELETILRTAEIKFADLDRQDTFKRIVFENAVIFAESGTVNVAGLVTTLAAIFGFGAFVDNRRKDTVIKTYKSANGANADKT